MKNFDLNYNTTFKNYLDFLKKNKLYERKKIFFYENNIEKMSNWSNSNFAKTLNWYHKIRKSNNFPPQRISPGESLYGGSSPNSVKKN